MVWQEEDVCLGELLEYVEYFDWNYKWPFGVHDSNCIHGRQYQVNGIGRIYDLDVDETDI